jgi:hypothetical protein
MCALCGVIGGNPHWTDGSPRPGAYSRVATTPERRRERQNRVAIANQVLQPFGMKLADWQGAAFLLSTATGKSEMVDDLSHLWVMAEKLAGRACDPLAPETIAFLEKRHG